jgi:outer membrane protein TolC
LVPLHRIRRAQSDSIGVYELVSDDDFFALAWSERVSDGTGFAPLVQLSDTWINGNNPVFVFGSLLEQGRFAQRNFDLRSLNNPDPLTNFRFGVTIKLPLFDGRQTSTRVAVAKLNQKQADAHTDQVAQRVRFEALKAYYGILLAQMKKEVADEAVKLAEADVGRSRDRVETGATVSSDLLSAEAQLAEFRQRQIQAAGEIVIARAALNTALGLPVDAPQNVSGRLVTKIFNVAGQDELMRTALERRPDYSRAALAGESRREQLKGARGEFLPRVDVFANAGASRNDWADGSDAYPGVFRGRDENEIWHSGDDRIDGDDGHVVRKKAGGRGGEASRRQRRARGSRFNVANRGLAAGRFDLRPLPGSARTKIRQPAGIR